MNEQLIIKPDTSLKDAWSSVLNQVSEAVSEGEHPFRYVTLATVDNMNSPQQRTVVLRDFNEKSEFLIYTDSRSDKVGEIIKNSSVSLLFYHHEKKLQLRVTGSAAIIQSGEEYNKEWEKRGSKSPHSYTSVLSPGTDIGNPKEAYHWLPEEKPNFCLIKIEATYMEFLQLDGINHIRAEKIIHEGKEAIRWITP